MYEKVLNFIKYNNAFTVILGLLFFGSGVAFAANPDVRDSVYASTETVVAVDNGFIVSVDLDNFNFNLRINSITDDAKNYYTTYSYQSFVIEDGIWQNKDIEKVLTVNKEALEGKDLGLYLARELGENINYELSYLKRVQKLEREKGQSPKIVTVEYSGLIGKLLDPNEKVIEGYSPVIPEVVKEVPATVESNPAAVIVSTSYAEPQNVLEEEVVQDATTTTTTTTTTSTEPAPEEMVDEELIQEVVEELLSTSTPEIVPEIVPEVTPEVVPEPEIVPQVEPEVEVEPTQ